MYKEHSFFITINCFDLRILAIFAIHSLKMTTINKRKTHMKSQLILLVTLSPISNFVFDSGPSAHTQKNDIQVEATEQSPLSATDIIR